MRSIFGVTSLCQLKRGFVSPNRIELPRMVGIHAPEEKTVGSSADDHRISNQSQIPRNTPNTVISINANTATREST